jgi:hypothetical protein
MTIALQAVSAESSESHPFSLFQGDFVSRAFAALGMGTYGAKDLLKRSLFLISITWVPLAILAIASEVHWIQPPGQNFFVDFAAYGQLLLGLPMFLVAERLIDAHTARAARYFVSTGVIGAGNAPRLQRLNGYVIRLRTSWWPEIICITLGYALTSAWMIPELHNDRETWHALGPVGDWQSLTAPGWFLFLFVGPLTTYWWLRWSWKIGIWSWYLYHLSRFRLQLVASHPDRTGGIGFLSDTQTKFGFVILAYGCSYVAPTILYKLVFEGATFAVLSVWGYAAGFVIGAPLLFTLPLFMFTAQLYRAKQRALETLHERSMERAQAFEQKWMKACSSGNYELMSGNDLAGLNALNQAQDHIAKMRVVPFDMRSFSELVGAALGPLIPLLPYVIDLPEPWLKAIQEGKKLLH